MNERIKLLAEQAGLIASEHDDLDFKKNLTDKEKKFAELIVRECMEQVWYTYQDKLNENISEVIKDRIKQHFGVEE